MAPIYLLISEMDAVTCLIRPYLKSLSQLQFGSRRINPRNFRTRPGLPRNYWIFCNSDARWSREGRKNFPDIMDEMVGRPGWWSQVFRNPGIEETIYVSCIEASRKFRVARWIIALRSACMRFVVILKNESLGILLFNKQGGRKVTT